MRVLHLGKFYPPAPGGIESYLSDLVTGLSRLGVESTVLAHCWERGEPRRSSPLPDVTVVRVPTCGQVMYVPVAPSFPLHLHRLERRFRPDVLHVHVPNAAGFWPLLTRTRTPVVVHWHADVILPPEQRAANAVYAVYSRFEHWLLRCAAAVVATSEPYLNASPMLRDYREKCRVVPLGAEPGRLYVPSPEEVSAERAKYCGERSGRVRLFLSAGRFSHYKGFRYLVDALRQVEDGVLVMVGSGETAEAIARQVREAGVADRVHLLGRVSDRKLHTLMAAADVFCLPSVERTEAFGMVLLEAMYQGTPCISTDIPGSGTGWVNARGETGLVVPPFDSAALAGAMRLLAEDDGLRERMGQAARRRFDECFHIDRTAGMLRDVYAWAASSR